MFSWKVKKSFINFSQRKAELFGKVFKILLKKNSYDDDDDKKFL